MKRPKSPESILQISKPAFIIISLRERAVQTEAKNINKVYLI